MHGMDTQLFRLYLKTITIHPHNFNCAEVSTSLLFIHITQRISNFSAVTWIGDSRSFSNMERCTYMHILLISEYDAFLVMNLPESKPSPFCGHLAFVEQVLRWLASLWVFWCFNLSDQ